MFFDIISQTKNQLEKKVHHNSDVKDSAKPSRRSTLLLYTHYHILFYHEKTHIVKPNAQKPTNRPI